MKLIPILLVTLLLAAPPALAQTATESPLTQSENAFALDLYAQLSKSQGNLFFSPASIGTALGMLYVGARGKTATQTAHTLHIDTLLQTASTTLQKTFLQALNAQPPFSTGSQNGITLDQANALWGAAHYKFNQSYVATIRSIFHGALTPVNFNNAEAAAATINNWVANHTAQKIQNLISPAALGPATRLVLTNAVYFKADWQTPFDKSQTASLPFYNGAFGAPADTMQITGYFNYAAGYGTQVLEIPYHHDSASMIVVLPTDTSGITAVEAALTVTKLDLLVSAMSSTLVQLQLPKFTANTSYVLNSALKNLGIAEAFDPGSADFGNITPPSGEPFTISEIIHKAYIKTDESGTEAAAATAITIAAAAAPMPQPPPPPPIPFIANHPFIYLIRDNTTGQILFLGRITNPIQIN